VDECKPLPPGAARASAVRESAASAARVSLAAAAYPADLYPCKPPRTRGLHSSTCQHDVSTFGGTRGIQGVFRECLWRGWRGSLVV